MLPMLDTNQTTCLVNDRCSVEIDYKPNESTLRVFVIECENREIFSTISISGRINDLAVRGSTLLVYSAEGYLYTYGMQGEALELPVFLGKIHLFRVNGGGDILTISTVCELRLFNLSQNKLYINTNIFELIAANQ
jgi:hypothetical protein